MYVWLNTRKRKAKWVQRIHPDLSQLALAETNKYWQIGSKNPSRFVSTGSSRRQAAWCSVVVA
jgi:hypothetical protein